MTESKEKERAIAVTAGQVLGLALFGASAVHIAGSAFSYGLRGEWGHLIIDIPFLAISLYYSSKMANRIAEKLEK